MRISILPAAILVCLGLSLSPAPVGATGYQKRATARHSASTSKGMTNAEIVKMVKVGLSDDIVIAAIRDAKERNFNLTPAGLIGLKEAGVSDHVIAAVQGTDVSAAKGIQDSIRDIHKQLAKEKNVAFNLTDVRSDAKVVLTVVQRGVGYQAYGQRLSSQYYYSGADLENTPMVAATYWTSAILQVGKYKKEFTGTSVDSDPMQFMFKAVTFGAWGRCAKQIADNLSSWVATNASLIRRNIDPSRH